MVKFLVDENVLLGVINNLNAQVAPLQALLRAVQTSEIVKPEAKPEVKPAPENIPAQEIKP